MVKIAALGITLGGLGFVITVVLLWNALALQILWGWFITPLFGLPEISIAAAIGITLVITLVTQPYIANQVPKNGSIDWGAMGFCFVRPGGILLVGWIVKTYFM